MTNEIVEENGKKYKIIKTKKGTRKVPICICNNCGGEHFEHKEKTASQKTEEATPSPE